MRGPWKSTLLVLSLLLVSAAGLPAAANENGTIIAEGHIPVGVLAAHAFMAHVIGLPPGIETYPWSFVFDPTPATGDLIEPLVTDGLGTGHVVRLYFYDGAGRGLDATCTATEDSTALLDPPIGTLAYRERCLVPVAAAIAVLAADVGVQLDVAILRTT